MNQALPVVQPGVGLPGINRPLDNTALSAYMACPREYYFAMVLHRRGEGRSAALAFGGVWHKILEVHYRTGGDISMAEMAGHLWWQKNGIEAEGDYRTLERALLCYKQYREKWGQKPSDEQGRTVGWPDEPMVEIATDSMGHGLLHPYAGKIDRIIELGGLYYIEDHKTTSRLDKNYYRGFELSQQMMGYTYLGQQLMPSLKIVGVRINLLHAIKTTSNFERQLFTYTKEQIDEWMKNTNKWMKRLSADAAEWEGGEPGPEFDYPIGHLGDNGCSRKYGLCTYHDVCSIATPFRHRRLEEYPINEWNPLETED